MGFPKGKATKHLIHRKRSPFPKGKAKFLHQITVRRSGEVSAIPPYIALICKNCNNCSVF